ncbi:MAG: ABC-2 type transport system permease protein [Saprospiraceae bacterium]|jgi:ABC-2 type transport system permease protein
MRRLFFIVQKEFIQIFRNKAILPLILIVPIVQLIVLSYAANNEVRNVRLAIVNQDQSASARHLINKIQTSDRFIVVDAPTSIKIADRMIQSDSIDIILTIPPHFEKDFLKYKTGKIQLLVNAINGQQATVGTAYLSSIIQSFNQEIRLDAAPQLMAQKGSSSPRIQIEFSNWYNQDLNYKDFMVPGILGELVTILVLLLTAMNIVREREIGTIEQINVTPIRKWQFIIGKMIPFLIIGIFLLSAGLTAGKLIFDIPIRGSLLVVFAYCILNLIAVLGLGLLMSNLADTQQQAMFIAFFFVIIFVLMCGLFTPIESMPKWAQYLTIPNPIAHFVHVMRSVLLKGSGFADVAYNFQVTAILAVVFNALAVLTYRKVT